MSETRALPQGDIYFDGETIFAGGVPLAPGRYAIGDSGYVLDVRDGRDDVDELTED